MKFIPLNAKDRKFISEPLWNWQFLRGVQRILNVTHGVVMTGDEFFHRAFGESEKEFIRILHMPEHIIMHRERTPKPLEIEWTKYYNNLTRNELNELTNILCSNKTMNALLKAITHNKNYKLKHILEYYMPDRGEQHNLSNPPMQIN
jgi:hypothetical protein